MPCPAEAWTRQCHCHLLACVRLGRSVNSCPQQSMARSNTSNCTVKHTSFPSQRDSLARLWLPGFATHPNFRMLLNHLALPRQCHHAGNESHQRLGTSPASSFHPHEEEREIHLSLAAVRREQSSSSTPGCAEGWSPGWDPEGGPAVASPASPSPLPRCQSTRPERAQLLQSPRAAFLLQPGLKVKDQLGCFVISFQ